MYGPDYGDSDGYSDDGDYFEIQDKIKQINFVNTPQLTDEQKLELKIKAFLNAVTAGNLEFVLQELDNGLDINIKDQAGWTPILMSASVINVDLTRELLNRGADCDSSRGGTTPLMMVCNCNSRDLFPNTLEIIKLLIDKGANVRRVDRNRTNALMFAAANGNLEAVKFLLPLSTKEAEDNKKWTALFWAVNGNQPEMVKFLLDENFNYEYYDVQNNTPLDLAIANEFHDIADLFPNKEEDCLNTISLNFLNYELFENSLNSNKPQFSLDMYKFFIGIGGERFLQIFLENNITLDRLYSITNEDLKYIGIEMPNERKRILDSLYKFHKYPYNPKSLVLVGPNSMYSNEDVALQIVSLIKQLLVMEASVKYLMNNIECVPKNEVAPLLKTIRRNLKQLKSVTSLLDEKSKKWDLQVQPADLITKHSTCSKYKWRHILLGFTVVAVIKYYFK